MRTLSWQSTPVLIGLREPIFRPNVLGWGKREQALRYGRKASRIGSLSCN
jgi:hypothetical protein